MCTTTRSKPRSTDNSSTNELSYCPPRFTPAGLAALYSNLNFALGFSNGECQAAARALLRNESHLDGTHYHTKTLSGLHPAYIAFNKIPSSTERQSLTQEEFVETALEDVFDALATQDRLDGGLSLLIRCPGSHFTETTTPDRIAVDLYITPRELREAPDQIGGDVSVLVQAFCEEFAMPHLRRFMERCSIENITPPNQYPATPVNPTGSPSLPAPLCPTGARIQCSAHSPRQFQRDFVIAALSKSRMPPNPKSAAVKHATALASSGSVGSPKIKQRRNADAFLLSGTNAVPDPKVFAPLLSIGPNTDAMLDRFKIGDEAILKLRDLIVTVRSSRWEVVLRSPKWDLTYEQAANLTKALHADLSGAPLGSIKKTSMLLSVILKCEVMPNNKTTSRRSQGLSQCRPKVILSKEARALLTSQRRQKSKGFKTALNDAWLHIDETVKTIALSHHKSIRRVANDLYMGHGGLRFKRSKSNTWNAFCWKKNQEAKDDNAQTSSGKGVLQDLLHNYSNEYPELSQDEKNHLVKEYEENKLLKSKGIRISMKSKINDVTQTLKAIENKLNSLKCHTGAETILYTVWGSTNIPLRGIIFATEGVNDFMASVMNIDDQHLVSKMEGAAHNYKDCCSEKRALIRQQINRALQEITKVPKATMQWANYWRNVVQRYCVICEGWPTHIPFKNLSEASTSLPKLQMLHDMWKNKLISWRLLDEDEYQRLLQEHNKKVNTGEIVEPSRRPRSDKGKKRVYKSLDTIESSDEEVNAPHTGTSAPSPSAPSPSSVQPSMSTSAPSSSSPSASTSAPSTSTASAST
ncbi:hypothetical protein F4604DRAFT_1943019 [Suillus subluteus]|nr:hypothetical protein F4604DRAFT_1943019 [Suillus subluteus]